MSPGASGKETFCTKFKGLESSYVGNGVFVGNARRFSWNMCRQARDPSFSTARDELLAPMRFSPHHT